MLDAVIEILMATSNNNCTTFAFEQLTLTLTNRQSHIVCKQTSIPVFPNNAIIPVKISANTNAKGTK